MTQKNQQIKQAAALSYHPDVHPAPILVAKGKGETAEKIINLAKEHNIPIQEDASLVQILNQLKINESIPEELYKVVAELFAFLYQIDRSLK